MQRTARFGIAAAAALAISAAGATSALGARKAHAASVGGRAVFVQNDRLEGNQVVAYSRSDEGTLTQVGVYDTGGNGGQLEGSVVDHTASQGALALDAADGLLFAVNAGSNSLSVFSVSGTSLTLRQVVSSGGAFPVSVTASAGYVYVLNAGDGGSIQGLVLDRGRLYPIPRNHRDLGLPQAAPGSGEQFTHTPGQIAFTPDGAKLIVTTKAAGQSVEVFNAHTLAPAPVVTSLPGTVPFALTFDPQGRVLLTEAGPSAFASFSLSRNGQLSQLDLLATEQVATCWVAGAAGYYYTSNAGSASLTGFSEGSGGVLTKLGNTSTHPGTVDAASAGRFLYVQGGKEGTLDEFEVQSDGSLKSIGSLVVPDAVGGEGIVAAG
jgi:DNA-binding beta-propeller fold protein YncE